MSISDKLIGQIPLLLLAGGAIFIAYNKIPSINDAALGIKETIKEIVELPEDKGSKLIGEGCSDTYQCSSDGTSRSGISASLISQIKCCSGKCRLLDKGALGIYSCPEDNGRQNQNEVEILKTNASTTGNESLKDLICDNPKTKAIGETCNGNSECSKSGFRCGPEATGIDSRVRCDPINNKCIWLTQQDSGIGSGIWWLPRDCRRTGLFGEETNLGTCNKKSPEEIEYENEKKKRVKITVEEIKKFN